MLSAYWRDTCFRHRGLLPPHGSVQALSPSNAPPPIVSVDAPSGWGIEEGPRKMGDIEPLAPDMLVSLTAPKQCAQYFKHHGAWSSLRCQSALWHNTIHSNLMLRSGRDSAQTYFVQYIGT
eukprot:1158277-Pelagomonas_calceolata.AAC.2